MKDHLKQIAKENGLRVESARVSGQRIYFVKTQQDQLLNNGYSMDETEALEFLESRQLCHHQGERK